VRRPLWQLLPDRRGSHARLLRRTRPVALIAVSSALAAAAAVVASTAAVSIAVASTATRAACAAGST